MLCKQVLIREGTIQHSLKANSGAENSCLLCWRKINFPSGFPTQTPALDMHPNFRPFLGSSYASKLWACILTQEDPPFLSVLSWLSKFLWKEPIALTLETKMPLREGSQKGHVSTVCILFVPSPSPTLHSLKHGLLEDRTWMLKVMLLRKVHWSTFTTIIKQTRGRLIDDKEEILAEDAAQWWSTH